MLDSRRRKRKRRHPPHFFKVYLPSFSSKRLKIPTAFLKHMKGVTSGTCTLIGPSQKIWNVSLRQQQQQHTDECFFEQGWPVFVTDHSVQTGDFFVFRYDGDLRFKVQIFGSSTFEKESAFEATCSQQHRRRVELDDPIHEPVSVTKEVEDLEADSVTKESEDLEADSLTKEACVYKTPIKTLQKGSKKHQGRTKRRYLSSEADSGCETETTKRATKRRYLSWGKHAHKHGSSKPQRRCITEEEKSRVTEAANAFKSKNPFTIVVLRPSYVYYGFCLSLPCLFWRSHLSKCDQEMILWDQSGRAWPVKYIISNTKGGFSGGWGAFARHHNLEADDLCIFELIKAKEMRVHIFRAVT